jgi:predicted transcriptional regulator
LAVGLVVTPGEMKSDEPIIAPNYPARRSELAKSIGLGQNNQKAE